MITNKNNIEWKISNNLVDYNTAIQEMEQRVLDIYNNNKPELIWFLEHPHIITKGASAKNEELLNTDNIQIVSSKRGGKFTYHGPGQLIIYPVINLNNRYKDLKLYIYNLEEVLIRTLNELNINAFRKNGLIGVWVKYNNKDAKIAAIGVRVSKWIAYHGIALNINPNLSYFNKIIPCGIKDFKPTSLQELMIDVNKYNIISILQQKFLEIFT